MNITVCPICPPRLSCLQYVKDSDEDLARAAIRAVGQIALKASSSVEADSPVWQPQWSRLAIVPAQIQLPALQPSRLPGKFLPALSAACPLLYDPCHLLFAQVPDVNGILDRLLLFLGYEKDYVTAETLVQVRRRRAGAAVHQYTAHSHLGLPSWGIAGWGCARCCAAWL